MIKNTSSRLFLLCITGFFIIFLFVLLHAGPISNWRFSYSLHNAIDSEESINTHELSAIAEKMGSDYAEFMDGFDEYIQQDYNKALQHWTYEEGCVTQLCLNAAYNKGNALYYQGEESDIIEDKKKYREESIQEYEYTLQNTNNEKALHNKKIVEKALEELELGDQEQQGDSGSDQGEGGDGSDSGDEEQDQEGTENKSGDNDGEGVEHGGGEESGGLSQNQREQLQQYQEALQNEQFQNQQFFQATPGAQNWQPQTLSDLIFGRPQQLKQLPNNEGEKDW